jgi:hypothetical protein
MFSAASFTPTYSGPITASGDLLRRNRNTAMSQAEYAGNERAFRPMRLGMGAGSGLMRHQGGIASDVERAKGYAQAQQAMGDYETMLANAQLGYQTNVADEQAGIANLLLKQRQIDQGASLDLRENRISRGLADYKRRVENESARFKREASVGGILAGLFRS